ncbi:hypothetical protein HDV63DRAFT_246550 [Trichoderma sp. SZMC 28014]
MKGGPRDSYVLEQSRTLQDTETSALLPIPAEFAPYRHCVTAIIDITNLDGLRYSFGTNGYSTEDVSSYLARAPSWPTEKEDAFRKLVTRAFARFKHMENLDVLPGACQIHIHPPFVLIRNRMKRQILFAFPSFPPCLFTGEDS